jgi:uncharacterized membrane protein
MNSTVNVADVERWASALGGAALTAYGIKQLKDRSPSGAALAAAGSALIMRGATGHCPVYAATGLNTVGDHDDTRAALGGARGINVEEAVTINASAEVLYAFWRRFELLPQFMDHLVSVSQLDARRSRWTAKAPAGRTVEWEAEIINDLTGELISWRTVQGSQVVSAGSVTFAPASGGRGTQVNVRLQYDPPAGKLGAIVASLLGHDPASTIREDLRRFKQLMEAGEIPTTQGQPRGKQSILNYD